MSAQAVSSRVLDVTAQRSALMPTEEAASKMNARYYSASSRHVAAAAATSGGGNNGSHGHGASGHDAGSASAAASDAADAHDQAAAAALNLIAALRAKQRESEERGQHLQLQLVRHLRKENSLMHGVVRERDVVLRQFALLVLRFGVLFPMPADASVVMKCTVPDSDPVLAARCGEVAAQLGRARAAAAKLLQCENGAVAARVRDASSTAPPSSARDADLSDAENECRNAAWAAAVAAAAAATPAVGYSNQSADDELAASLPSVAAFTTGDLAAGLRMAFAERDKEIFLKDQNLLLRGAQIVTLEESVRALHAQVLRLGQRPCRKVPEFGTDVEASRDALAARIESKQDERDGMRSRCTALQRELLEVSQRVASLQQQQRQLANSGVGGLDDVATLEPRVVALQLQEQRCREAATAASTQLAALEQELGALIGRAQELQQVEMQIQVAAAAATTTTPAGEGDGGLAASSVSKVTAAGKGPKRSLLRRLLG
jgi:hypothetical protein